MKTKYTNIIGTDDQISKFLIKVNIDIDYLIVSIKEFLVMPFEGIIIINLCDNSDEVQRIYKDKYYKDTDYKAFISLNALTIWISIEDTNIKVLSHEIGHAILESFCNKLIRMPYNIHELIAQYTEKNIINII